MADEDLNKGTAAPGSEPGKIDGKQPGAEPGKGQPGASPTPDEHGILKDKDGKPLPWDQQPKWKSARETEKKVQGIMEANGFESFDDLVEHIQLGKTLKGKVGDVDALEKTLAKAATLEKYEKYWAEQKEKQLRETETPEERADRLERELKEVKGKQDADKKAKEAETAAQKAIKEYDAEVTTLLSELPKDQKAFLSEFLGVGNPINDIDITDKKAVKKVVADGRKKLEAFQQATIKAYLAGKLEIPDIGTSGGGAKPAPGAQENKNFKLRDARKELLERGVALLKGRT